MIIQLEDAIDIDSNITKEACLGLETMVRKVTNNNFHDKNFRCNGLILSGNSISVSSGKIDVFKEGNTIEINDSKYNDGLYVITSVTKDSIIVDGKFIDEVNSGAIVTKVVYPADVLAGVKKLIAYDLKMADKIGVKSESISRWSVTYYDVTSTETEEGYPLSLLGFLKKYRKIRWS
ncbi:hypothetical protein [Streptococcus dysgalactiae]|uniref:Phage protein n=1 Tax=Streptococcus dysgalactiae TaxID=1334 RepID=A0ABU0A8A4_STRDY|nr:hypothetical protein [Streptococcus dysgalactiae]EGL48925.1 hypothetical protein HMPREF9964_0072 [Streptococcus dysgalactiae subsp. equisimilis SK1249]MDQ0263061.1 hypothetical protein [Streptococcus dysgalactiae]QQC56027.1 hypothetical protein I6H73_03280 [Streptococcus dysgalactiae]SUN70599.1 Uncharacterised protein [Streptococcus dysgalactiae]